MLIIGYPVYWLELYLFKSPMGKTTFLAPFLFILFFVGLCIYRYQNNILFVKKILDFFKELDLGAKVLIGIGSFLSLFILGIVFYSSLFPPHLVQEFDFLNYHVTIPRQHLITHSFAHLPWSSADLYLMPVQFALTPFWLCTKLLNKLPQFIFLMGLISISAKE